MYGPTETTLAKVFARIDRDHSDERVSVGKPMDGAKVFIINEDGSSRCSDGEIGEVYIQTKYMSFDYLYDEASRFPAW